jgi:hypothetical protein
MGREKLGLELFQEGFSLLLHNGGVGHGLGRGLRLRNGRDNVGRNPLLAVAGRADVEVGGIVETAFGTRHAVA